LILHWRAMCFPDLRAGSHTSQRQTIKESGVRVDFGRERRRNMNVGIASVSVALMVLGAAHPVQSAVNAIGVYSDATGQTVCEPGAGPMTCFVMVSDVTDPVGISGWQFALRISPTGWLLSPQLPANSINLESFPRMRVGCATPLPTSTVTLLLTFTALSGSAASIYIDELAPNDPILLCMASSSELERGRFAFGGLGQPVFSMGGAACPERNVNGGVVETESASWGGVKSLYR
jgi:hypothetical protein